MNSKHNVLTSCLPKNLESTSSPNLAFPYLSLPNLPSPSLSLPNLSFLLPSLFLTSLTYLPLPSSFPFSSSFLFSYASSTSLSFSSPSFLLLPLLYSLSLLPHLFVIFPHVPFSHLPLSLIQPPLISLSLSLLLPFSLPFICYPRSSLSSPFFYTCR